MTNQVEEEVNPCPKMKTLHCCTECGVEVSRSDPPATPFDQRVFYDSHCGSSFCCESAFMSRHWRPFVDKTVGL